jgi:hypothetical protein
MARVTGFPELPWQGNRQISGAVLSARSFKLAGVPGALRLPMPDPRTVGAWRLAGWRWIGAGALLMVAIAEQAAAFHRSLGFRPAPLHGWTLMLPLTLSRRVI